MSHITGSSSLSDSPQKRFWYISLHFIVKKPVKNHPSESDLQFNSLSNNLAQKVKLNNEKDFSESPLYSYSKEKIVFCKFEDNFTTIPLEKIEEIKKKLFALAKNKYSHFDSQDSNAWRISIVAEPIPSNTIVPDSDFKKTSREKNKIKKFIKFLHNILFKI